MSINKIQLDANKVIELFNQGHGIRYMCNYFDVSDTVIRRYYKELNLSRCGNQTNTIEVFWSKINKIGNNKCWEWMGQTNSNGYGEFKMNGKRYFTHRLIYLLIVGEIDEGNEICHVCDNPICCNPAHLFSGTAKDNVVDCYLKGRGKPTKLTPDKVKIIRHLYANGSNIEYLMNEYNVAKNTILDVVSGRSWSYIS